MATLLATCNIEKAINDHGMPIIPKVEYTRQFVRYSQLCVLVLAELYSLSSLLNSTQTSYPIQMHHMASEQRSPFPTSPNYRNGDVVKRLEGAFFFRESVNKLNQKNAVFSHSCLSQARFHKCELSEIGLDTYYVCI